MSGPILCEFFDNQTTLIHKAAREWEDWHTPERLSEEWKARHAQATFACDVQDLVQLCIILRSSCGALWRSSQKSLLENRSLDYQDYGKKVEFTFDATLRTFAAVRSCVRIAIKLGYLIENQADFDAAEGEITVARSRFVAHWPWIDKTVIGQAEGQYALGQHQTLDEFINDLQGHRADGG